MNVPNFLWETQFCQLTLKSCLSVGIIYFPPLSVDSSKFGHLSVDNNPNCPPLLCHLSVDNNPHCPLLFCHSNTVRDHCLFMTESCGGANDFGKSSQGK